MATTQVPTQDPLDELAEMVSKALERLKRDDGVTQAMIAERAGTTQPTVSRIAHAAHVSNWHTVKAVALALGLEDLERVEALHAAATDHLSGRSSCFTLSISDLLRHVPSVRATAAAA